MCAMRSLLNAAVALALLGPGTAAAHVGAVVSKATFCAPPPPTEIPSDAGAGLDYRYAPAEADTHYLLQWQDGDTDPTGKFTFYYVDHQIPIAVDATTVETMGMANDATAGLIHTVDQREARDIYVSCACVAQDAATGSGGGDPCDAGIVPSCNPDAGARWCDNAIDWDTSAIPDGVYWIAAVNNDPPYHVYNTSVAPVRITHGGGHKAPIVIVTRPDGLMGSDTHYTVQSIVVGDPPLTLDYAYGINDINSVNDPVRSFAHAVPTVPGPNGAVAYDWDVSALKNQVYFVSLTVTDGSGAQSWSDSRYGLSVYHHLEAGSAPDAADAAIAPAVDAGAPPPGSGSGGCAISFGAGDAATWLAAALLAALALLTRRPRKSE
jgi:hypothetical protein